jgi:hypothetical protein
MAVFYALADFQSRPSRRNADFHDGGGAVFAPPGQEKGEPMEKIHYVVTETDDRTWETLDADIARLAFEKGSLVVEMKEYTTYSEYTMVRLVVSTQLTSNYPI